MEQQTKLIEPEKVIITFTETFVVSDRNKELVIDIHIESEVAFPEMLKKGKGGLCLITNGNVDRTFYEDDDED